MTAMTPTTFAAQVDSDGRTVRKFLRATTPAENHPGKGSRWVLPTTKRELNRLAKQFAAWQEENTKPAPEPEAEVIDEVEDDAQEPTDEELEELEVTD